MIDPSLSKSTAKRLEGRDASRDLCHLASASLMPIYREILFVDSNNRRTVHSAAWLHVSGEKGLQCLALDAIVRTSNLKLLT